MLAHGLEHLDTGDGIINTGLIPVILQLQRDHIRQPGLFDARLRIDQLFAADGQTSHFQTALASCVFGKPAPAASDFQHMVSGFDAHLVHHGRIFGDLGIFHAFLPGVMVSSSQRA